MPTDDSLHLKEDKTWKFSARYFNGKVSFKLTSKRAGDAYPASAILLDEKEWDRLVKWVAYHRAEDALD